MPVVGKERCSVPFNIRLTEREYRALMHHSAVMSVSASAVLRRLVHDHVIDHYLDIFGGSAEFQIDLPVPK